MLKNLPIYATAALFTLSTVTLPNTELSSVKFTSTVIEDPMVPEVHLASSITLAKPLSIKPLAQISIASLASVANIAYKFSTMGTYSTGYPWGQCTWGVATMKGNIPDNWGNANMWPDSAKAAGYTVGSTPEVGAVGVSYEGALGHVVVVTALNPDGTIQITETNYAGELGVVHTRDVSPSSFVYIYI